MSYISRLSFQETVFFSWDLFKDIISKQTNILRVDWCKKVKNLIDNHVPRLIMINGRHNSSVNWLFNERARETTSCLLFCFVLLGFFFKKKFERFVKWKLVSIQKKRSTSRMTKHDVLKSYKYKWKKKRRDVQCINEALPIFLSNYIE